jgi:hypothetical protein
MTTAGQEERLPLLEVVFQERNRRHLLVFVAVGDLEDVGRKSKKESSFAQCAFTSALTASSSARMASS